MKKVKIYGAGSIGNHLAQASRRMGWEVDVVDPNQEALERMQTSLYPSRYGAWDDTIKLFKLGDEPSGGYDLIFLGTPPHVRIPLAKRMLAEEPRILLLEKPLCGPNDPNLQDFVSEYGRQQKTIAVMGYDHAVSTSVESVRSILRLGGIGPIQTMDVNFREHWQGIFAAHPWLSGPEDTYLGFSEQGGGASGEHSHALHLWVSLLEAVDIGRPVRGTCIMDIREQGKSRYDALAAFTFRMDSGRVCRVIQDVVTLPSRKTATIQGTNGVVEWSCNKGYDLVRVTDERGESKETRFEKTRPDDFYLEMQHLDALIKGEIPEARSPISLASGVKVMEILRNAHHCRAGEPFEVG